ncbi:MFS transporter [soil metagenome]
MSVQAPGPRRGWQAALAVQSAASQAAWQGIRLMLAYQALAETNSPAFVGIVSALIALAGLVVSIPSGRLLDRFGGAWVALGGIVISLLGVIVVLVAHNIVGLLISSVLVGVGYIHVVVAQQGTVARLSVGSSPDAAFGALTSAVSIGQLIGPPVVTMAAIAVSNGGAHPNTWIGSAACGLLFLIAMPPFFMLRRSEQSVPIPQPATGEAVASLRTVLRSPAILRALLVGAAVLVTVDLLSSFIPVWAVEHRIPADVVGWLLALRALFTITSRIGAARLVARFGRKALLIASLSLGVLALLALPFSGAWAALPVMAALGLGLGLPQPLSLVWMSSLAPPHARGAVFGARMTVNRFSQVTLPLLVATIAGPAGMFAVFWATAGILASSVVIVGVTPSRELNTTGADEEHDQGPDEIV